MKELCEQKNPSEKPWPSLASVGVENQKPELPSRRVKSATPDCQKFSVYALIEGGIIRYVGLTSQTLSKRLNQHFQDLKRPSRKEHKTNWLRKCKRDGLAVSIKPLRVGLSLESAQKIEKQIIARLRRQLVNVHDGGSSGYAGLPVEAKRRHSESGKARYLDPKEKAKARVMSKLGVLARERNRIERALAPIPDEPKRYVPHPRTKCKWRIQVRDEETGDSFTVRLYRTPWPGRWVYSEPNLKGVDDLFHKIRKMLNDLA